MSFKAYKCRCPGATFWSPECLLQIHLFHALIFFYFPISATLNSSFLCFYYMYCIILENAVPSLEFFSFFECIFIRKCQITKIGLLISISQSPGFHNYLQLSESSIKLLYGAYVNVSCSSRNLK